MSIRPPSSSGTSERFVGADKFSASLNTPALSVVNKWPVWLMDQATNESIGTVINFEEMAGWQDFAVDLWWTNAGAGAGTIQVRCDVVFLGDGGTLVEPVTGTPLTLTAPAQSVIEVSTLVASQAITADALCCFEIVRIGGDAVQDTLANDAGFIGLNLRRA